MSHITSYKPKLDEPYSLIFESAFFVGFNKVTLKVNSSSVILYPIYYTFKNRFEENCSHINSS